MYINKLVAILGKIFAAQRDVPTLDHFGLLIDPGGKWLDQPSLD